MSPSKVPNDDAKRMMMNAFCAGRSISEIAMHYTYARLTVEQCLRESIVGLSALVHEKSKSSGDSLVITEIEA